MALTKSMAYDNPVYEEILTFPLMGTGTTSFSNCAFPIITGANGQSTKFAAFTNMLVKSITLVASTVGTSSVATNLPVAYRLTNNGTTGVNTVTVTYTLTGSGFNPTGSSTLTAAYVVNAAPGTGISTSAATGNSLGGVTGIPLLPGDLFYIAKGTDATEVLYASVEAVVSPLANVTP